MYNVHCVCSQCHKAWHVVQESRARWNSLDGVLIFGWSGSAFVGGILVDKYGFDVTFCLTAAMQAIGVLILVPLLFLVPRKEGHYQPSPGISAAAVAAVGADAGVAAQDVEVLTDGPVRGIDAAYDLQQPLLEGSSAVDVPLAEAEQRQPVAVTEPVGSPFVGSPYFA